MSTVDAISSPAPDWQNLSSELHCPLCAYNLRGLTDPRCPECGYRFDWLDLTDESRKTHPYLFEHQSKRNVRSFILTALAQLFPWRFWRSLRPAQRSAPLRLIFYWIISVAFAWLVPFVALYALALSEYAVFSSMSRAQYQRDFAAHPNDPWNRSIVARHGSVNAYLDYLYPRFPRIDAFKSAWASFMYIPQNANAAKLLLRAMVLWPWLTLVSLALLRASMRQARIRTIHVMRCVLYSFDIGIWFAAFAAGVVVRMLWLVAQGEFPDPMYYTRVLTWCAAILFLLALIRLIFAYGLYLQFRHSTAVVILTQIIVLLSALAIVYYTPGMWERLFEYIFT